jgi:hypothetical protein
LLGLSIFISDSSFAQSSKLSVNFEDNVASSYDVSLTGGKFAITQDYSWVKDETSRYNLVSYSIDGGEPVKIARSARGSFTLDVPSDSSEIVFSAVVQHALTVAGTNDFSFLPSSPTQDNWFDSGTEVSINVSKITEVEKNKVRQEITGWSLDKSEFWNIEDDGSTFFVTPPVTINEYHLVDFFSSTTYKLNVISDIGTTIGSGWYKQGEIVPISVDAGGDGLILNTLSGWEGDVEYDGNNAQVFVDGPVTVSAKLEKNYSLLIGVIIVPILVGGFIVAKKFKRSPPITVEKPVEKIVERIIERAVEKPEPVYSDKYDEELSSYLSEQIKSKLDEMYASKIISDLKYSKIKIS